MHRYAEKLRGVEANGSESIDLAHATPKEKALLRKAHQTLRRVTNDFEARWHFNSSIALIMELVNEMHSQEPLDEGANPAVAKNVIELLVLMLAPMAPHVSEELWEILGHSGGLARTEWPKFREDLAKEEQFEVIIQINGRVRGKILVDDSIGEEELVERAIHDPRIAQLLAGKKIVKTIVVPRKLVNIVVQ